MLAASVEVVALVAADIAAADIVPAVDNSAPAAADIALAVDNSGSDRSEAGRSEVGRRAADTAPGADTDSLAVVPYLVLALAHRSGRPTGVLELVMGRCSERSGSCW